MLRTSGNKLIPRGFRLIQHSQVNSFSSSPNTEHVSSAKNFLRTSEVNPNNLSEKHLGRFYTISSDTYKHLYDHGSRHHGFPIMFRDQCETFRENCIMVRKPYLELKKCVDALDMQKPVVRFLIYGNEGSGRTITLTSMVHYGHVNEFIIVNFTWIPLWTNYCKELVPSTFRQGFFDHTLDAVSWLTKFKLQNSDLVQKLNLVTEKDYQWSKREVTPKGSLLLEIIEQGISRPAHATECMSVLFQELKNQSSQQKCKTMVLVDGVNDLFYPCPFLRNPTNKRDIIPMSSITAFVEMKKLFQADWCGGVVIGVVDKLARNMEIRTSDFPRYLLEKEGWEIFDPFVPIEVTNYSSQETQTTIDYFLDRKWLAHPGAASEEGRLELEYLSTRNPFALAKICSSK